MAISVQQQAGTPEILQMMVGPSTCILYAAGWLVVQTPGHGVTPNWIDAYLCQ